MHLQIQVMSVYQLYKYTSSGENYSPFAAEDSNQTTISTPKEKNRGHDQKLEEETNWSRS